MVGMFPESSKAWAIADWAFYCIGLTFALLIVAAPAYNLPKNMIGDLRKEA